MMTVLVDMEVRPELSATWAMVPVAAALVSMIIVLTGEFDAEVLFDCRDARQCVELIINLKTAKAFGLAVPLTPRATADEPIE